MARAANGVTRILGIDPGLNVTGYGVVECRAAGVKLLEAGVIHLPRSRGENLPARLELLYQGLGEVLGEFHPQTMCLEEVYSHTDYPKTSILMGHARGVICLAARLARVPVVNFSAKRIKQSITGNGNASKNQVQRAVQQFFSLHRLPQPPDVADALAAALCYANSLGTSVKGSAPNSERQPMRYGRAGHPLSHDRALAARASGAKHKNATGSGPAEGAPQPTIRPRGVTP
jgi:crossover junction endodeoxyribonuclease RuvC